MFYTFEDYNKKKKKFQYELPESDMIDLYESICTKESFKEYVTPVVRKTDTCILLLKP